MNKNINNTLQALVPILRMNGEKVKSIEAVEDWYWHKGHEYMKEVAEITYDSGYRKYADIECDSNLTACYDVLAVIQQIKRPSTVIERIERGVYEEVAECRMSNLIDRPETHEKCTETHACDLIRRQDAIDALIRKMKPHDNGDGTMTIYVMSERLVKETLNDLPVAQPERCEDCENFNKTRSLIPQPERKSGEWIDYTEDGYVECPFCHSATNCDGNKYELHFCFSCGADMRGEQDE